MKSFIIVDDNPLERTGIENLVDWRQMGIHPIGNFRNGKHALEKMDELQPDIVLTDIQMPVMNGIELTRRLKASYPHVTVVFMSSYEQFEYAKSALSLGVEEYILKPVIAEKLQDTFERILNKIRMRDQLQEEKSEMLRQIEQATPLYQEQFFKEYLVQGLPSESEIRNRLHLLHIHEPSNPVYYVLQVDLDMRTETAEEPDVPNSFLVSYSVKKYIQSVCRPSLQIFPVQLSNSRYAFIVFMDGQQHREEDVVDVFIGVQEQITDLFGWDITIGISNSASSLLEVPGLYKQASKAAKALYYTDTGHPVFYRQIEEQQTHIEEIIDFQKLYDLLKEVIFGDGQEGLARLIDEFVERAPFRTATYMHGLRISILNFTQLIFNDANRSFAELEPIVAELQQPVKLSSFMVWVHKLMEAAKESLLHQPKSQYDKIVEDIKRIIESRFNEQITLQDIANAIYLSPSHLNNIFKSKMGKTVFDYMIECRMEAAKKKLKDPYSRIYLVAQEVGYTNKSHFCLIFKKYTGVTPSEFRRTDM